jgi:2-succinyl-5-enolpyruvyl-6-hydroxy-3-cyclohexene-1-carboxylate synthase
MNPSTAFAHVVIDELVRGGVRDAVLAPGSRSAPLALALAAAERAGRIRLHVRIDERTAAFLALGLAKRSGSPVPVVTTSGTAAAHLHAAVLEADASGLPLLALTCDRPPELRATGANQTVDQVGLYGGAVRWAADVGVPEEGREQAQNRYWRSVVCRALAAATGALSRDPGPVQLNLALREPLLPSSAEVALPDLPGELAGRAGGAPWTAVVPVPEPPRPAATGPARTLVVAGDCPPAVGRAAADLADACHWPVVAEPSSGLWAAAGAVRAGALILGVPEWLAAHRPDRVLVVGRPTLSRPVAALLADPQVRVETVAAGPRWADAGRGSARVSLALPLPGGALAEGWRSAWLSAAERAGEVVDGVLARSRLTAARLARDVVAALPAGAQLVLGSSTPVRDADRLAVPRGDVTVLANRGVAGIDGTVSTAVGAALAHARDGGGATVALIGDLTLLHDLAGLVPGDGEPMPDLTFVVPDNDGGGIFAQLEPGADRHARDYRRVFGTPHGRDLVAVTQALGWSASAVSTPEELAGALRSGGPRVVVVRTDQRAEAALAGELRTAVAAALR